MSDKINLDRIRIILVGTSHTGNMGAVARAMKTMELSNLYLVDPLVKPDSQATAMAAGASDILYHAKVVNTLDEALAGCQLVIGTSARNRALAWPMLDPRECGIKIVQEAANTVVALVFGRERIGLTNDELQKCHYHVVIDANPDYSSLNLAMAVQILAYEIRIAWLNSVEKGHLSVKTQKTHPLANDLEHFYHHLETVLLQVGFIRQQHPGQVMNKLRRLFVRSRLEQQELNILRGILTSVEMTTKNTK